MAISGVVKSAIKNILTQINLKRLKKYNIGVKNLL